MRKGFVNLGFFLLENWVFFKREEVYEKLAAKGRFAGSARIKRAFFASNPALCTEKHPTVIVKKFVGTSQFLSPRIRRGAGRTPTKNFVEIGRAVWAAMRDNLIRYIYKYMYIYRYIYVLAPKSPFIMNIRCR